MIGDTLRFLREKTNKTQEETAKALGIKRSTYSHFENNRNNPDNETLVKMANYFNVSTDYLLGRDPKEDALKTADLADDDTIFTFEGKPIPEQDLEYMKRLLRGGRK
ncbi:helix-turn-helix domain-containing protein [Limosilactobacillus mucosae]|jgi:transcriptional regulator with XRE-family HTH domain|uniref:helix-turn-helix domain-containing protein n=1 Tax=Limosilactobacillus mucosae TaxID=97478 RepID=UPI0022E64EBD|nr:helix-turn-helix transcriptional regulator [Limosilactobacillus mucosae]